ncbi:hypothetical protein [Desulfovibrio sp.]|uniref:hypothetical protein n=1 Tax=Desulfovibrio sp. TaxID=885 RepID=UPI0025BE8EF7|nr:hypothetical protein [Desulfovibrio sp.]
MMRLWGIGRKRAASGMSRAKAARDGTVWIRLPPEAAACDKQARLRLLRGKGASSQLPAAVQG